MRPAAVLPGAADIRFGSVQDVLTLLGESASAVRRGLLDCKVGNCSAYVCSIALRALQESEIEKRLEQFERLLTRMESGGGFGHGPA
jgi:hypothetical protein